MSTLSDWVTYSDQISVVRVDSEQSLPVVSPGGDTSEAGTQSIQVHLSAVRNLWVAPDFDPRPTVDLTFLAWTVKDGVQTPLPRRGIESIVPGDVFVAGFAVGSDNRMGAVTWDSVVAISGAILTVDMPTTDAVRALRGKSVDEMAELLRAARPHDPQDVGISSIVPSGGR